MKPTVGRIVHYVDVVTDRHLAAIITDVTGDTVSLCVFGPTGPVTQYAISQDDKQTTDTWHWPEKE